MDDGEHFGGGQNSVHLQETLVEELALQRTIILISGIGEPFGEILAEAVDFVSNRLTQLVNFPLGQPLHMQVTLTLEFHEILSLITVWTQSRPQNQSHLGIKDTAFFVSIGLLAFIIPLS